MRDRLKVRGSILAALLLTVAAPAAFAQRGGPREDRGMHHPGGRDGARGLFEYLDLTDEQREAWTAAHRSHFEALKPTFEKMRELHEQIETELDSGSADAATVGGYMISLHALRTEIEAGREELEAAQSEILTDEQETKLEAFKAANPDRDRHHGPGFGGRRGAF
jgi:Spy/CpxP family protein refolding chaperone